MNNSVNNLATAFSQNSQLIDSLKAAIQTQIEMGDPSISRFNQAIDLVIKQNIKPILDQAKGKMSSSVDSSVSSIKDHFCRGRKWVTIPKDHDLFGAFVDKAQDSDLGNLLELWESHGFAWVRFHSTKGLNVNFSLHPNSSVGSNIKVEVPADIALELDVLNGTPKSNGYEVKAKPKAEVKEEPVVDDNEKNEVNTEDTTAEVQEETTEVIDQNDDSQNDADNQAEIEALLAEDLDEGFDGLDIDCDIDIENL